MFRHGKYRHQRPIVEAMEAKLLYSADLGLHAFAPAAIELSTQHQTLLDPASLSASDANMTNVALERVSSDIVFIDATVPDLDNLTRDLAQQAAGGRHVEVVVIRADEDGLTRITQALQDRHDIGAIHLIGHGASGGMQIGTTRLDAQSLMTRAGDIAQWGTALSTEGDLLLYGCEVGAGTNGHALVQNLAALTGADVAASDDLTGASVLGGDWVLEVQTGEIQAPMAISYAAQASWVQVLASSTPSSTGSSIFPNTSGTPVSNDWDGFTLGSQTNAPTPTNWTVVDAAQAPTRNESIVMGVDSGGTLTAYMQREGIWSSLGTVGTGLNAARMGFGVEYEQSSGDAVMVWDAGSTLNYRVWNGSAWSGVSAFSTTAAPDHMILAAQRNGDQMTLVYSGTNVANYALVWNGSAWGNQVKLGTTTGTSIPYGEADGIDIAVAYEALSGTAMVAYAENSDNKFYYRLFENNAWGAAQSLSTTINTVNSPFGDLESMYITLASDPHSDRIVMGRTVQDISLPYPGFSTHEFAVWSGSAWGARVTSSKTTTAQGLAMDVAFESDSGDAIAVYHNNTNVAQYRTWTNSGGWSTAQAGPTVVGKLTNVNLFTDPYSDLIMVGALDENNDGYLTPWTGSSWGAVTRVTTNAGASQSAAYTWLWDDPIVNTSGYNLLLGGSQNSATGWNGVNAISKTEALVLNDSGLSLGDGSTSGNFSHVVDLSAFGLTDLTDIAWVSRAVTLSPSLSVTRGDILFTTGSATTLSSSNTLAANANDLIRFRPDVEGDYSAGTFTRITNINTASGALRGLALVEKTTVLGDVTLAAGSLLFTQGSANSATSIYKLDLASGLVSLLLDGTALGLGTSIAGLELISAPTTIANAALPQASLLISLQQAGTLAGLSMTTADVAKMNLTRTSVSGTAAGSATMLVQGSGVGITSNTIDTLALIRPASDNSIPVITSNYGGDTASIDVAEGLTSITTAATVDPDAPGDTLTYSLSGTDAARFTIHSSTGVLTFRAAPDYEAPTDSDADNVYSVTIQVTDGTYSDTQALTVTVTPINDNTPAITSNGGGATASITVTAGSPVATAVTTIQTSDADLPADALTYTISGGADAALFNLDSDTGVLTFKNQADISDGSNYAVIVQASDGANTDTQTLDIRVVPASALTPVITSNGGGSSAAIAIAENTLTSTVITTLTATDIELPADTLTYSLSGDDAGRFTLNGATGELTFNVAPDHEVPLDLDGDNVYNVILEVADQNGYADTQDLSITVTPINEFNPTITSNGAGATGAISLAENTPATTPVATVTATDGDTPGDTLTYAIDPASADAASFSINASTGELRFNTSPDYESPTDVGANNTYNVTVQVSDGVHLDTQDLAITVTADNDNAPVITSHSGAGSHAISVAENTPTTTVITVFTATDADVPADTLTYTLAGADKDRFTFNSGTGALTFNAIPDHENPTDVGGNNVYSVSFVASDGRYTDVQALTITVTAINEFLPLITSNGGGATAAITLAENTALATTVVVRDEDTPGDSLVYVLSGDDAALFSIDSGNGDLSFTAAPDYELPSDLDDDNVYNVTVQVGDGSDSGTYYVTQALTITVNPTNDNAPAITSNGGGATASVHVNENTLIGTAITTVTATDADIDTTPDTVTYSLSGTDAAQFDIDSATGVLTFKASPDHELPTDADVDNVYNVIVTASDRVVSGLTDTQDLAITVDPVNDNAPIITSHGGGATAAVTIAENTPIATTITTVTATDADTPGDTLRYTLSGTDAAQFDLDSATGVLTFRTTPDHELPADAGGDNVYNVTVTASDRTTSGLTDTQDMAITVTPLNDNAPVITSNGGGATASISIDENTSISTAITTIAATDVDTPGDTLRYALSGADAARFDLDSTTGVLTFKASPDHELPADGDGDNVYHVTVTASDQTVSGLTDAQDLTITVAPLNDNAPVITSNGGGATAAISLAENTPIATAITIVTATDADSTGDALRYTLSGTDAAQFDLDSTTGALTFKATPDHERPADEGLDNIYNVTITASDRTASGLTDTQDLAITVIPLNDNAPVITSNGGGATASIGIDENTSISTAIATVTATDADTPGDSLRYALSGADAAQFNLDSTTGVLSFKASPDHERPADQGGDNVYNLTVTVSDQTASGLADTQVLAITVTGQDEPTEVQSVTLIVQPDRTGSLSVTVTDVDTSASGIDIAVSTVSNGRFLDTRTNATTTAFTLLDIQTGAVVFLADFGATAPTVILSIGDGSAPPSLVTVDVTQILALPPGAGNSAGTETGADDTANDTSQTDNAASGALTDSTGTNDGTSLEAPTSLSQAGAQLAAPPATPDDARTDLSALSIRSATTEGLRPQATSVNDTDLFARVRQRALSNESAPLELFKVMWTSRTLNATAQMQELDRNFDALSDQLQEMDAQRQNTLTSAVALGSGLSAGYVIWLLRSGTLLGSMLSAMPAWQMIDPLPVLARSSPGGRPQDGDDNESEHGVEAMFDGPDDATQARPPRAPLQPHSARRPPPGP